MFSPKILQHLTGVSRMPFPVATICLATDLSNNVYTPIPGSSVIWEDNFDRPDSVTLNNGWSAYKYPYTDLKIIGECIVGGELATGNEFDLMGKTFEATIKHLMSSGTITAYVSIDFGSWITGVNDGYSIGTSIRYNEFGRIEMGYDPGSGSSYSPKTLAETFPMHEGLRFGVRVDQYNVVALVDGEEVGYYNHQDRLYDKVTFRLRAPREEPTAIQVSRLRVIDPTTAYRGLLMDPAKWDINGDSLVNIKPIMFHNTPEATIRHVFIRNVTTGEQLCGGQIAPERSTNAGDTLIFEPGEIRIKLGDVD